MLKKFLVVLLVFPLFFTSCENHLDIIGEWKEVAIVYGLLDPAEPVNYVRVEKAFLGEGNALIMAQQHDSIYYDDNLSVVLERRKNGQLMNTIIMERDTTIPKDPGVFASDGHVMYKTDVPILADSDYSLIVQNEKSGYTATAHTPIVDNIGFQAPIGGVSWWNGLNTTSVNVRWLTGADTRIYEVIMRFYYAERTPSGLQADTSFIDMNLGTVKSKNLVGNEVLSVTVTGEQFYNLLTTRLSAPHQDTVRVAGRIEFILTSGAEEFSVYLDVIGAASGISQTTPTYTNVNNGLGLFSSRTTQRHIRNMDSQSIDRLACHQPYRFLKFLMNNQMICP